MEQFYSICKKNNLKITPQRVAIYRLLMNDTSHPTADGVYQKVKLEYPNISFDTVNRTLTTFSSIGLIGTIECSGQGKKYDPNNRTHHHLNCIECDEIIDFYCSKYDKIEVPENISKKFKILSKKVLLMCICDKCMEKKNKGEIENVKFRSKNKKKS